MGRKAKWAVVELEPGVTGASSDGFEEASSDVEDTRVVLINGGEYTISELRGYKRGQLGDLVEDALNEQAHAPASSEPSAAAESIRAARKEARETLVQSYREVQKCALAEFDEETDKLVGATNVPSTFDIVHGIFEELYPADAKARFSSARSGVPRGELRNFVILSVGDAGEDGLAASVLAQAVVDAGLGTVEGGATRESRYLHAYGKYLTASGYTPGRGRKGNQITYRLSHTGAQMYNDIKAAAAAALVN